MKSHSHAFLKATSAFSFGKASYENSRSKEGVASMYAKLTLHEQWVYWLTRPEALCANFTHCIFLNDCIFSQTLYFQNNGKTRSVQNAIIQCKPWTVVHFFNTCSAVYIIHTSIKNSMRGTPSPHPRQRRTRSHVRSIKTIQHDPNQELRSDYAISLSIKGMPR